jgi:hypothetical protein
LIGRFFHARHFGPARARRAALQFLSPRSPDVDRSEPIRIRARVLDHCESGCAAREISASLLAVLHRDHSRSRINYAASELDCAQSELREAADLLTSVRLNTTPFDRDSCL